MSEPAGKMSGHASSRSPDWRAIIREAGCFDYLLPKAERAVDEVLRRCPNLDSFLGVDARGDLTEVCVGRLRRVYERPIMHASLERMHRGGSLPASLYDLDPRALHAAAETVREDLSIDGGEELEDRFPLAREYGNAIVRNFASAISEMLDRLLQDRAEIASILLDGNPIGCIRGFSDTGIDTHRHGRSTMRIQADGGAFYYKPRHWELDALCGEILCCWFPGCAIVPRFVSGSSYSFAEDIVKQPPLDEEDLGEYWHHLGALASLFHGLGSRDMTEENILCAGTLPAIIDTETLLAGELDREDCGSDEYRPSVTNSSLLPWPGREERSPLTTDNASGTCLPRVEGAVCTIEGFEGVFMDGFAEGRRRLLETRSEILELIEQARDVTYRKVVLNTQTYERARSGLYSTSVLRDASRQESVVRWLWNRYDGPPSALCLALSKADMAALVEGDIPYYTSKIGGLDLHGPDPGIVLEGALAKSALDVARQRMSRL